MEGVLTLVGIIATFLVSVVNIVITCISISKDEKNAKKELHANVISTNRLAWQDNLRKTSSEYFTALHELCGLYDPEKVDEKYHNFLICHYTLRTLLFDQNQIVKLLDDMFGKAEMLKNLFLNTKACDIFSTMNNNNPDYQTYFQTMKFSNVPKISESQKDIREKIPELYEKISNEIELQWKIVKSEVR